MIEIFDKNVYNIMEDSKYVHIIPYTGDSNIESSKPVCGFLLED